MKKTLLLVAASFLLSFAGKAQLYSCQTCKTAFFSSTPVEDIAAESAKTLAVINTGTGEVAFSVDNESFIFPNKLMQEHFNEKYMESGKYPKSTFKGKINETVNYSKNGEHKVTVTGKLNVHGVEKDRTIAGTVVVKDGTIGIRSEFKVPVAEHKITVPKLVVSNIAEEIKVTIDCKLLPKK
jgi:polyisoprenoid-binding protein YceI